MSARKKKELGKLWFFKFILADHMKVLAQNPSMQERGKAYTDLCMALEEQSGKGPEIALKMIDESKKFHSLKSFAGKEGMKNRYGKDKENPTPQEDSEF